ncbi:hypothetical protein [Oxynema sp. CENA135]|nr:hypothetical protein [Oxynema sp. CENA135]
MTRQQSPVAIARWERNSVRAQIEVARGKSTSSPLLDVASHSI